MTADAVVRFALKKTVKDLNGLTTNVAGEFVDVKKRLEDNGGVIATEDPTEIEVFRGIDALKEVSAKEATEQPTTPKENK
jgi:hypothetical protein